jgi:glyoxylase-like metal-dependent hydrolase (beta-lactamase superfamily II)
MGGIMIVEFKDFLVVVECPGNFWMSQSTIEAVKKTIPNKPIKYVVPSHTHGDHGGGARAYFYAGTTLLTTAGNVEFYKKLARIKQTIRPDPLFLKPKEPIIETFKGNRIITDGTQTLELYDFGANPHTEELIFAYLPNQKILWQSDIIFNPMTGNGINKAMPIGVEFAKKLKELKITDFTQVVESHHDRVITIEDFRKSLQMAGFNEF